MAKLSSDGFGLKMYSRFPPKYREDDVDQRYALRRYLEAAGDGGFKYTIDEWNGIMDIVDPDKVRFDILKIQFAQYGLEVFNGIPEHYLRFLLPLLGEAWSKKGALSIVEFMTSAMSGIKTSTTVTYDEYDNPFVTVKLEMDYNIGDYFPDTEQFERLIKNFLPFYVDFLILYSYVFEEETDLKVDEELWTIVRDHSIFEYGFIPHAKGERLDLLLNTDRKLNEDFVLNGTQFTEYEPDEYIDIISFMYNEVCSFYREYAEGYYHSLLNTDRTLNDSFVLNGSVPVDDYSDLITFAVTEEKGLLDTEDRIVSDVSTFYEEVQGISTYHVILNQKNRRLNIDFVLNYDSEEHKDTIQYVQSDSGIVHSKEVTELFKQVLNSGSLLNETFILNEPEDTDSFIDKTDLVPTSEGGSIRPLESQISTFFMGVEESTSVTGRSLKTVLNEKSELNKDFVLNDSMEQHHDSVVGVSEEAGGFMRVPEVSELNLSELNNNFVLNVGFDDWDYITQVGVLNTTMVLNPEWRNSRTLYAFTLA